MKCLICNKEFKVGEWTCSDGVGNHVVAEKTYRAIDAPSDPGQVAPGSFKQILRGQTVVCNIPPAKKVMVNGEVTMIGEGSVTFINGRFTTDNPELQYWLDKKPAYNCTEEQWKSVWMSKEEQLEEKRLELVAMQSRLENQQNELLAQTKKRQGAA